MLKFVKLNLFISSVSFTLLLQGFVMIMICVFRLTEEQRDGLSVDQVNKDLKNLAKQAKATKYSDVMKLLRLVLSGLQVLIRVVW